jgi:hypothetical protein
VSTDQLPIPATESAIDVRIARADVAPIAVEPEEARQ